MTLQPIDRTLLVTRNVALACFVTTVALIALYAISTFSDIIPSQLSSDMSSVCFYGSISLGTVTFILGLICYIKKHSRPKIFEAQRGSRSSATVGSSYFAQDWNVKLQSLELRIQELSSVLEGLIAAEASDQLREFQGTLSSISSSLKSLKTAMTLPDSDLQQTEICLEEESVKLQSIGREIDQLAAPTIISLEKYRLLLFMQGVMRG